MAEAFNSLFKAELVRNQGPWRSIDDLEIAVAEYIDWFNHRRLHGEIGLVPPVEFEAQHHHTTPHPLSTLLRGRSWSPSNPVLDTAACPDVVGTHRPRPLAGWLIGAGPPVTESYIRVVSFNVTADAYTRFMGRFSEPLPWSSWSGPACERVSGRWMWAAGREP